MPEETPILFDKISFNLDAPAFLRKIDYERYKEAAPPVDAFIQTVSDSVKPKAVYRAAYIDERTESTVKIGGEEFISETGVDDRENVDVANAVDDRWPKIIPDAVLFVYLNEIR